MRQWLRNQLEEPDAFFTALVLAAGFSGILGGLCAIGAVALARYV